MTRRTWKVVGGLAALSFSVLPGVPAGAEDGPPDVARADLVSLSDQGGELRFRFREGGRGDGVEPGALRFIATSEPGGVVPGDAAFGFLGAPGTPVWSLGSVSAGLPAIDTTGLSGRVTLELAGVDGPGSFAAYRLSAWGRPELLLDSDGPRSVVLPRGRLGGLVWMFGAPGEYRVTLRAVVGASRDEVTYRVTVPGRSVTAPPAAPSAPNRPAAAIAGTATNGGAAGEVGSGRKVIADGHVDMGPQLVGGSLVIRLKDDTVTPAVWQELSDVVLKVGDKALIDVPDGDGYAFLGGAGDRVYLLPQSQQAGIVWPGWNTQHESMAGGTRGDVAWQLTGVAGPGAVKLFLSGSFGAPEVVFDSAKGLPQQLAVAPNTHAHGNWAFTKAGVYRLTVRMTATTTGGKSVSDTRTLMFAVGDSTETPTGEGGETGDDGGTGDGEAGDGGTGTSGDLARTGVDVMTIGAGGVLLLAVGTAAVLGTRRRRSAPTHSS